MRPLGRDCRAPGELDPPNVLVSSCDSESPDQLPWSNHECIESLAIRWNNLVKAPAGGL
jgi:hypothetical protein